MTTQEHDKMLLQAKAHLRTLERRGDAGVEQARAKLDALRGHVPGNLTPNPSPSEGEGRTARPAPIPVNQLPPAVRELIERLTNERNAIHAEKSRLANALHLVPDEMNAKEPVKQILTLRQAWRDKQDQIYQVMQTGVMPESAPVASRTLDTDPEKVRFAIGRLHSNINKMEKRRAQSKELATQKRQDINLAQMQAELAQLKTHLATL